MTALLGAGMDFAREHCRACDGRGTPAIDPLDPAYFAPLAPHPDLLAGCGNAAISGEIFLRRR